MRPSLDLLRRPSALAVFVLLSALAVAWPVDAAQRRGDAPGPGGPHDPAVQGTDAPPAATATAAPFVVRCRWRSEKSGDGHARELARVLAAVAAAAADAGLALGGQVLLFVDVYDGPRELERATAALTAPDVVRTSGAVREPGRGAVHVALRPRIADRMHYRFGTSPFLVRRAAHEGARLLVDTWLGGQALALEPDDDWAAESVSLALAEEGLRRAARSVAPSDEVATSHGLVLLARALVEGTDPLVLLGAAAQSDAGHGEACTAAQAARLAVGAALLAPAATDGEVPVDGGALADRSVKGLLTLAARPGALLGGTASGTEATGTKEATEVSALTEGALDETWRATLGAMVQTAALAPALWEEVTPGTATWPALLGPVDPTSGGEAPVLDPGGLVQWALPRTDALVLATEPFTSNRYVLVGTFEPLPLDGESPSQADVAFADHSGGDRCLCVFNTREGTWVLKRDPKTGEYGQVTGDAALRPVAGKINTFELRVVGDTVVVVLNGQAMGAGRASGLDLSGRYGLGAHGGSAVIWRGVHSLPPE